MTMIVIVVISTSFLMKKVAFMFATIGWDDWIQIAGAVLMFLGVIGEILIRKIK